jgi:hypothetical protein
MKASFLFRLGFAMEFKWGKRSIEREDRVKWERWCEWRDRVRDRWWLVRLGFVWERDSARFREQTICIKEAESKSLLTDGIDHLPTICSLNRALSPSHWTLTLTRLLTRLNRYASLSESQIATEPGRSKATKLTESLSESLSLSVNEPGNESVNPNIFSFPPPTN